MTVRWAIRWHEADGPQYFMWNGVQPYLFRTRREAREAINEEWGYVKYRADLRAPPCNWRMPRPVKVSVILEPQ